MIGRTKARIRGRKPRVAFNQLTAVRYWLLLSGVVCFSVFAGSPPATVPPPVSDPSVVTPDEGLIEFLGGDDVGDAAWWEFLKKALPRGKDIPATPPQDAKQ